MDQRVNDLFHRMRASAERLADRTEEVTSRAVDAAGKKATDMVESTRINMKIYDLNADVDRLYREIGKMLYDTHLGEMADQELVQEKLEKLDEKHREIEELREKLNDLKSAAKCPVCGKECKAGDTFCSECGAKL